ncbi:hypothetical protein [Variovorax boronicumulans]|uniref:hypothetical protein n=1 Tax=Variovorax boronicumulans TaxID=436515 RepID=UPI0012E60E65|nr:hypothetical protein [Variovorax boronicumulans]GER21308.1 hypothetical protein VCH24_63550 [Variovorax boronicumulans]
MTTTEAFETLMPEPFGYVPFPGEFYPPDQLDAEVKDDPFTTRVYTAAQMRAMFDAATERAAKLCESEAVEELTDGDLAYNMATRHCAAAIRAREDGVAG